MLWIFLNNQRIQSRIGVLYEPQESRTKKNELIKIYKNFEQQIHIAAENNQNILLYGDFNAKIDNMINGNKAEVSKAGNILKKLIEKNYLAILNRHKTSKGKWTRTENRQKSILDFILLNRNDESVVKNVTIDEDRLLSLNRIDSAKTILYTDYNAIITEIKWYQKYRISDKNKKILINKERLRTIKSLTSSKELQQICQDTKDVKKVYDN